MRVKLSTQVDSEIETTAGNAIRVRVRVGQQQGMQLGLGLGNSRECN